MPLSYAGQLQYNCLVLPDTSSTTGSTTGSTAGSTTGSTSGGVGPGCLSGPRGDWEPCEAYDSSNVITSQESFKTSENDSADQVTILDFDAGNTTASKGGVISDGWAVASVVSPADFVGDNDLNTLSSSTDSTAAAAAAAPPAAAVPLHPSSLSEAVQSRLAVAAGSTVYSHSPRLPRYSLSGQACWQEQGFRVQGLLTQPGQCASVGGREVCPVLRHPQPLLNLEPGSSSSSGDDPAAAAAAAAVYFNFLQCEPLIEVPINSTYCWIAASRTAGSSSSSGVDVNSLFSSCVVQAGLEFCRVDGEDGPWLVCPTGES
jgi:hypothetical protein